MPVLIRIAFRNLLEHKAKSLIVGILLALGVIILVVGNSFMDTAARGVKDTFISNYTGDIFVAAKSKTPVSLFGVQSMGGGETTQSLPYFDKVAERLRAESGVTAVTGQVTGYGMAALKGYEDIDKDENETNFVLLFGIDPANHYKLFTTAKPIKGRLLEPGESGLVVSKATFERIKKKAGVEPKIGDEIVITGIGRSGFKIRSVPLVGVISYKNESEATDIISYADVDTVRILTGLTLGNDEDTPVTEEQKSLLSASEDELFGGETLVQAAATKAPRLPEKSSGPRKVAQADAGAWHFAMARLKNPGAAPKAIASLNAYFEAEGIEAQASDWKAASRPLRLQRRRHAGSSSTSRSSSWQ